MVNKIISTNPVIISLLEIMTCKGCLSSIAQCILLMLVRGIGIRDIALIQGMGLVKSTHTITPKQSRYDYLEVDEFWTCVGNKGNKVWLTYACHRSTGEIVSFVWGKRDLKTAKKLRKKN